MTHRIDLRQLILLLHDDRGLYERLRDEGLLPSEDEHCLPEHADIARVVGTLIHELDVNWEGTEVILRMRSELIATRRQVASLLDVLNEQRTEREADD